MNQKKVFKRIRAIIRESLDESYSRQKISLATANTESGRDRARERSGWCHGYASGAQAVLDILKEECKTGETP